MVTKYIERKDVIEAICNLCRMENDDCSYPRCTIINTVKNIHAADVVERKRGHWRKMNMACYGGGTIREYECSVCEEHQIASSNFCPNCGSRMVDDGN